MCPIEAIKTEVFFASLNEWSPKRISFEMLESSLLEILWSLLKSVSLSIWKIGSVEKVVDNCFNSTTTADRI